MVKVTSGPQFCGYSFSSPFGPVFSPSGPVCSAMGPVFSPSGPVCSAMGNVFSPSGPVGSAMGHVLLPSGLGDLTADGLGDYGDLAADGFGDCGDLASCPGYSTTVGLGHEKVKTYAKAVRSKSFRSTEGYYIDVQSSDVYENNGKQLFSNVVKSGVIKEKLLKNTECDYRLKVVDRKESECDQSYSSVVSSGAIEKSQLTVSSATEKQKVVYRSNFGLNINYKAIYGNSGRVSGKVLRRYLRLSPPEQKSVVKRPERIRESVSVTIPEYSSTCSEGGSSDYLSCVDKLYSKMEISYAKEIMMGASSEIVPSTVTKISKPKKRSAKIRLLADGNGSGSTQVGKSINCPNEKTQQSGSRKTAGSKGDNYETSPGISTGEKSINMKSNASGKSGTVKQGGAEISSNGSGASLGMARLRHNGDPPVNGNRSRKLTKGLFHGRSLLELKIDDLNSLEGEGWIDAHVIAGTLMIVESAVNSGFTVLDPRIAFLPAESYRIPSFPVRGRALYPVNVDGLHWVLASFDTAQQSAMIYDSTRPESVSGRVRQLIASVWRMATDIQLKTISLAHGSMVCHQQDGYNCGVYTIYHGVRLLMGLPTFDRLFDPHVADLYRKKIQDFLDVNVHHSGEQADAHYRFPFQSDVEIGQADVCQLIVEQQPLPLPEYAPLDHPVEAMEIDENAKFDKSDCDKVIVPSPKSGLTKQMDNHNLDDYLFDYVPASVLTKETTDVSKRAGENEWSIVKGKAKSPKKKLTAKKERVAVKPKKDAANVDDEDISVMSPEAFMRKLNRFVCEAGSLVNVISPRSYSSIPEKMDAIEIRPCCVLDRKDNEYDVLVVPIIVNDRVRALAIADKRTTPKCTVYAPKCDRFSALPATGIQKVNYLLLKHGWKIENTKVVESYSRKDIDIPYYLIHVAFSEVVSCCDVIDLRDWELTVNSIDNIDAYEPIDDNIQNGKCSLHAGICSCQIAHSKCPSATSATEKPSKRGKRRRSGSPGNDSEMMLTGNVTDIFDIAASDFMQKTRKICRNAPAKVALMSPSIMESDNACIRNCCVLDVDANNYELLIMPVFTLCTVRAVVIADRRRDQTGDTAKAKVTVYTPNCQLINELTASEKNKINEILLTHGWNDFDITYNFGRNVSIDLYKVYLLNVIKDVVVNWNYDIDSNQANGLFWFLDSLNSDDDVADSVINPECFMTDGQCVCKVTETMRVNISKVANVILAHPPNIKLNKTVTTRIKKGSKTAGNSDIVLAASNGKQKQGSDPRDDVCSDSSICSMVSHLLYLKQESKQTDVVIMNPVLFNSPDLVFECMTRDVTKNNYRLAFMPVLMNGSKLTLIVGDRRNKQSHCNITLYQPVLGKTKVPLKKDTRAIISKLFASHGWNTVHIKIDSNGNKIDSELDIIYYLLFVANKIINEEPISATKPILRKFKEDFLLKTNSCNILNCAHYATCICNIATGNKASKKAKRSADGTRSYNEHNLGSMTKTCKYCKALHFEGETSSICCSSNSVYVDISILTATYDPCLKPFRDRILVDNNLYKKCRPLNAMLSCAYKKMNLKNFDNNNETPVVLEGEVKVSVCHLQVKKDKAPFALLFLASDEMAMKQLKRKPTDKDGNATDGWKEGVPEDIFEYLVKTLKEHNEIVKMYKTMFEMLKEEEEKRKKSGNDKPVTMLMNIKTKRDVPDHISKDIHAGRLNKPADLENVVAAIWMGNDSNELPTNEELMDGVRVLTERRDNLPSVPHFSPLTEALCYSLIYPNGQLGYQRELGMYRPADYKKTGKVEADSGNGDEFDNEEQEETSRRGDFVSRRQYILYMPRRTEDNKTIHRILGLGKLTAEYIIHEFTRIEWDRLKAIQLHRTEIRSTTPSARFSYLQQKLGERNIKLGKLIELPSYFPGSDIFYRKLYHKSMTVALREGNPDFFVTITGNPNWHEISDNLLHKHESWITDPLLTDRVFKQKLAHFFHLIEKVDIWELGPVSAIEYSIEFQKRGMPHAHVLITYVNKPTLEDIDRIVNAEIPPVPKDEDPDRARKLRVRVKFLKHNIHTPCQGKDHMTCRKDNPDKCSKGFPKPFVPETTRQANGFVNYKRRDDKKITTVGGGQGIFVNNAYVVPGNLALTDILGCHINVEACSGLATFKYIYKYIYKGADRIIIELTWKKNEEALNKRMYVDKQGEMAVDLDMAKEYVNARYIGQCEAAWRILGYPLHGSLHSVTTLYVHLPDEQPLYFKDGKSVPRGDVMSPLLAYFALMNADPTIRNMTWIEVDETHRYDRKLKQYVKYKREDKRISHLCFVPPKYAEKYALRCLLLKRTGATSFEDIRTVNGHVYTTFIEAAQALGYVFADNEWENCLNLMVHYAMPRKIRCMFASLLVHCNVMNAKDLWEKFKTHMRNSSKRVARTETELDEISISHIEWILQMQNTSLVNFGMADLLPQDKEKYGEDDFDADDSINDVSPNATVTLNSKQNSVMNILMDAVQRDSSKQLNRVYFLYGKAGCGKTFLTNLFIDKCRSMGKNVIAVASTGIAATLLRKGRTAHSTFHLPAAVMDDKTRIRSEPAGSHAKQMRNVDVIVWDEVCMQSKFAMEAVDKWLRDIAEPSKAQYPFGGKLVLFSGDWAQFLPVVVGHRRTDLQTKTVAETLKKSYLWNDITVLHLDENMRVQKDEVKHMEWLRKVGEGTCQSIDRNHIQLPRTMYMHDEKEVIDWIFTPEVLANPKLLAKCALLSVKNIDSLQLNDYILDKIPGQSIDLYSTDESVEEDDGINGLPVESLEFINAQTPSGMPPHRLRVKKGCIIMLLRNIDTANRLCNGTRLELMDVLQSGSTSVLQCRHINGTDNDVCFIQRMPLTYEEAANSTGLAFKRIQFPVRLCFSMTVNKSQGQTFDKVGLILRTPAFTHGCTYVALSRATSKHGIKVCLAKKEKVPENEAIWVTSPDSRRSTLFASADCPPPHQSAVYHPLFLSNSVPDTLQLFNYRASS